MVGERGDEMGEMNNNPLLMGMEAQTRSSHSTPMIPIFVDTNMDTHLALSASPSETIDDLRAKIRKGHLSCFPHLGEIDVGALMVKRKSLFYHLVDSMLVGSAFHGLKGTRFLLVEISQPDLHIDQGGPRANIANFENNSLLKNYHSNELQADDKRLPNNGSVKTVNKSMSDYTICQKPSLLAGGMDATQASMMGLHHGKLLTADHYEDCIMEDHNPQPFLNPELPVGAGEKIETTNSPPLLLNGTDGETGIPNASQSWNVQRHFNEQSNQTVPDLQNWRSVKQKKSKSVFQGSQVLEDCGQLSKSTQLLDENKERNGVAIINRGIFKESKRLGRENGEHEIPTTITNGEVKTFFDEKSNGMGSDLQAGESPSLKKKAKSAECSQVQKACGQLSNNIQSQTTSTRREENALNNEGFAEECEILGGREGNFGISTTNKKVESERLFGDNSNGNVSDIQAERVTQWKEGKLVAKCSQVKEGCGQLSNDIGSSDLVAARDEKVMINDVFTKESRSSSIGDEVLPANGRKRSKRKQKERCDLNEDSTGCGSSEIQEKNKRKRMTMEGNNIECSSKQLSENFKIPSTDFLSAQISRPEIVNVSKSVKEDGITTLTKSAMTSLGSNFNPSPDFEDDDIVCTQLSTGKRHETGSRNFDDEFPANTAEKESKDLQRKSDDARECVIGKKVNPKISIEGDSPKTGTKESKDLQSKVDDGRKIDIEKQVKPRRKMSSKHAILDYEQEDSAKDVNDDTQVTEHNPLLKSKCIATEGTQGDSIALKENGQRKDPMNVSVKYADSSTHMDGNQPCNISGKKKSKRSRNDLSRPDNPERITKGQVPKDDIVIKSGKFEGDESTPDAGKKKRTHTSGENGGIAYLSTEILEKNAIMDSGHISKARGMAPIITKEAYADSDIGTENRNNEKCDSGKKKVKLSKISPSKESQARCVGIDNRLIDAVVEKSGNSSQHAKDEVKKPKDTHVSSSDKKQEIDSESLGCQATAEKSLHKSTHVTQLDTNDMSYTRNGSKERHCFVNSTEKIHSGNRKVASEKNIVENSCHKLKQAKSSATADGFDRIQSSKEKQDDGFQTKEPQYKAEDGICNRNSTADSCHTQKETTGFVTDNVKKDRQSLGEQHGNNGASRKIRTPKKTHDGFSVNKTKNKDNFSCQPEKVLEKPKGSKHFTKNLQSLFKSVDDESTEEENETDSSLANSSSESLSGNSSDSLDSDGGSREKVSIKSHADRGPSTSGPLLSTATGSKQDTGGSGRIQSRFVHLLAKKTGLGELFKIASAQKKAESENFSGQFVSPDSPSTNMFLETQESQVDPLHTTLDNIEKPALPVTPVNTKGSGKVSNNKALKANSASRSCLESTPKASGKSYSPLVEKPTDKSVHLEASGKVTPQMQQSGRWVEPRTGGDNKRRTASKQ